MYYFLDGAGTTSHLGALLILDPHADGAGSRPALTYSRLVSLVENRLQTVPRYRQVVAEVSLGLARPLWVDDPEFDINFHIRLSALPAPGAGAQLQELVGRIMSRPLDHSRPLWEMYLIEGLSGGRLAILTKSHRCLVDLPEHRELSEALCDAEPDTPPLPEDLWMPSQRPGDAAITMGALVEVVARPGELVDSLLRGNGPVADLISMTDRSFRAAGRAVSHLVNTAPDSPLNSVTTSARLFTFAHVPREGCQRIADHFECTLNDVVLAIITGVLRRWLLSVQDSVGHAETVRAVVPLSARDPRAAADQPGVTWTERDGAEFVTDLPVGEDAPAVRLLQVAGLADRYAQSSRRISKGMRPLFPELGMVPFSERSTRAFSSLFQRSFNIPIVLGSGHLPRRYVGGTPVTEVFTVPTLIAQRALAVSVNEYADDVQFAFIADRSVLGDLPALAGYVTDSYEEMFTAGLSSRPQ